MYSIETTNTKVPPPKPFRRRLSFKTKPFSSESDSTSSTNNTLGSGFNSVRGSIRRFRRVSNAVNGASNAPTLVQGDNNDSNLTQQEQATTSPTNMPSPTFPSFQRLQTFASMAREQTSRLKDISITQKTVDLTVAVQEMSSEIGKKGVELGSLAREAVVERWKKKKEDSLNEFPFPHNSTSNNINIFGESLVTAVNLTRIEKDISQIENDPSRYWLPAIMVRCIEFLDKHGLEEVGLYRIPGSMSTVSRMKNIFNSGADLNFLQSSTEDPNAVATLLKMYLREIPGSILTEDLSPEFNECVAKYTMNTTNSAAVSTPIIVSGSPPILTTSQFMAPTIVSEELLEELSNIVSRLPPQHFYLLRALFSHLSRVNRNHGVNKMNTSNLGVIFRPNLGIDSVLFKAFVEHVDVVFGAGCKTESRTLEEEKRATKGQTLEVYHKTNISEEFTKSFEDLLNLDKEHANGYSSSHSYSSSSSSIIGLYVYKDTPDENKDHSVQNHLINNTMTTPTIKVGSPTFSSSSSSIPSPPTSPSKPKKNRKNDYHNSNNSFSEDETSSLEMNNPPNKRQQSVNIIDTSNTTTASSSSNSSFRMRSRSTGLRNIPLTALEYSSDSSEGEKDKKDDVKLPTLMAFDYVDKHGTKNLGVLNISIRPSSKWVLHHNGVGDDKNNSTVAWVRKERRPSLEETEKWKRVLNLNPIDPPDIFDDDDTTNREGTKLVNLVNEKSRNVGRSRVRDQILKFNGAS